jgi:hypothetical protein
MVSLRFYKTFGTKQLDAAKKALDMFVDAPAEPANDHEACAPFDALEVLDESMFSLDERGQPGMRDHFFQFDLTDQGINLLGQAAFALNLEMADEPTVLLNLLERRQEQYRVRNKLLVEHGPYGRGELFGWDGTGDYADRDDDE